MTCLWWCLTSLPPSPLIPSSSIPLSSPSFPTTILMQSPMATSWSILGPPLLWPLRLTGHGLSLPPLWKTSLNFYKPICCLIRKFLFGGCLVAQPVKCLMVDFGSGHDVRVVRLGATLGSAHSVESASDSLCPFSCPSPSLAHTLSLK